MCAAIMETSGQVCLAVAERYVPPGWDGRVSGGLARCEMHAPQGWLPLKVWQSLQSNTRAEPVRQDEDQPFAGYRVSDPITIQEARRNVLREAADLVQERQKLYGDMVESWSDVGQIVNLISSPEDPPSVRAVLTLIAMKLVRRKHSPEIRDHRLDLAGYVGVLDEVS